MANWEEIKSKIGRATNKALKKTEELADSASKHIKLKTVDGKLASKYEALGRLTYKQLKCGETQAEKISCVIEEIDSLRVQRKAIADEIEEDKRKRAEEKAAAEEQYDTGKEGTDKE